VRVVLFVCAVLVAGLCATAAYATVRPLRPSDAALLNRPATYEEHIAEVVAARLTHLHPEVRCGPLGVPSGYGILGITLFNGTTPAGYFLMLPQLCTELAAFHASPASYDPRSCTDDACTTRVANTAMALATVSHESYHLLGYRNEAKVECYGMQSIWFVASKLGASLAESQAIASFYATRMYPLRRTRTPAYWSPECREGGTLDLRPTLASWPS
jgi:hypothetical protein